MNDSSSSSNGSISNLSGGENVALNQQPPQNIRKVSSDCSATHNDDAVAAHEQIVMETENEDKGASTCIISSIPVVASTTNDKAAPPQVAETLPSQPNNNNDNSSSSNSSNNNKSQKKRSYNEMENLDHSSSNSSSNITKMPCRKMIAPSDALQTTRAEQHSAQPSPFAKAPNKPLIGFQHELLLLPSSSGESHLQNNTNLTLQQPLALSSQRTTTTTTTTNKACHLKKPPPPSLINLPSNAPLDSTSSTCSSEHNTTKADQNVLKDPILNLLEMELIWLIAESMYLDSNDPASCHTIQWDYVWEFAGPALQIELRKCNSTAAAVAAPPPQRQKDDNTSSAAAAGTANDDNDNRNNNNIDKQLLQQLIRMNDWLVSKRFAIVRDHILALLVRGYRRPSQAIVIAERSLRNENHPGVRHNNNYA